MNMEARGTKQDIGRVWARPSTKPNKQVGPDQPARKRRCETEKEERIGHTRRSPRLRKNFNSRRPGAEHKVQPRPPRKSPRLQDIYDLNLQTVGRAGKQTRLSPRTTRAHHSIRQEQSQDERRTPRAPRNCHLTYCGQIIPPQTTGAPVDEGPISTRKRHRGQDGVIETQAKRQKLPGDQAKLSRVPDADTLPLTLKNLKSLSQQHQPPTEETALEQWEFVNMPQSRKTETKSRRTVETSSSTKTVSTSDPRFQEIAINNGVMVPMDSTQPSNFDEIYNHLNRLRESTSPDLEEYKEYCWKAVTADNEETVKQAVLMQLKEYNDGSYRTAYNQQFTEYPANVGFNVGLSAAKPDFVQGINLQGFKPYPAREELGGSAVPTPSKYSVTLAHVAGEFKRPGGNLVEAESQAAYGGASLVYGRNKARELMGKTDSLGTAHVGSFISDGKHVMTFAHYATKDASDKIVYHQWPVSDTNIQLSHQNFKTGRRQVRNLQDWARENSYLLKEELLDHYQLSQAQSNEHPIPEIPEENEFSDYANGSEPYVLVDGPPRSVSHQILEVGTSYVTPQSFDSAHSPRLDQPASNADLSSQIPNQRRTRSSARLSGHSRRSYK